MNSNKNAYKIKQKKPIKEKAKKQYDDELTDKKYNELKNKCFFFLRRTYSQNDILENNINIKPLLNIKRKRKYRNLIRMANLNNEMNKIELKGKIQKKEEKKIIYDNYLPKTVWQSCKNIYNKYKKECKPLILESIKNPKKSQINLDNIQYKNNNKFIFSNNYDLLFPSPPSPSKPEIKNARTKSFLFPRNSKTIKFDNKNIFQKIIENDKYANNFIKCMDKKIKEKFENKGIDYILGNRELLNIKQLPKVQNKDDLIKLKRLLENGEINKKFPFIYKRRTSYISNNPYSLDGHKKQKSNKIINYKINAFFEIGDEKSTSKEEEEEENDLEIISKEGNVIIRELLFSKKENLEGYKQHQSIFNFFCLKKLFEINDYNIFGVINGKGRESQKLSRLLKEILIEKFSNEIYYLNIFNIKSKPKNFKYKNDFILNTLTNDGFNFIRIIFNSLTEELKKKGVDIEETGATLFIIILIKDKIISIKIGDMYSYFIYSLINDKKLKNVITIKPHFEQLISNIIEQDRFEENKCEFNIIINEMGQKRHSIIHNDKEIQKYLEEYNINFTRMVGFQKLKKIGIIGDPDIQMFSTNLIPEQNYFNNSNKKKKISDSVNNFTKIISKNGDQSTEALLKYIIIGNNELFEILKDKYYIKEINESILKDEENNKKKDNIKYCFNLKNAVKKLVGESVEIHKKYMNLKSFKERCLALVTLT